MVVFITIVPLMVLLVSMLGFIATIDMFSGKLTASNILLAMFGFLGTIVALLYKLLTSDMMNRNLGGKNE